MPQMVDASHMGAVTGTGAAASNAVTYVGSTPSAGMWFSFVAGGRNYLHLITAVDQAGKVARVAPLLRKPMNGHHMEFVAPKLEGFVDDTTWSLEYFRFVGHKFTLTESA